MATKTKKRKVYCLRVRIDDSGEWSQPDVYTSRKMRDQDAWYASIIAGYRTHSYEDYQEVNAG